MRVERCDTPEAFLGESLGYRCAEPLRTNVMSTVAASVVVDPNRYDECFWWLIRDPAEHVVGAAFCTPPYMLALGPMTDEAAAALACHVARSDLRIPGLLGRPSQVEAFASELASTMGPDAPTFVVSRRDVLYEADRVIVPDVPGRAEVAAEADLDLAAAWWGDFEQEVNGVAGTSTGDERRKLLRASMRAGRLHWWRDQGDEIVSMAGCNVTVTTADARTTRVGPVFTPVARRRRGYAAGVTAAVTTSLLEQGSGVMLFADESNATSNSVYQSLGYRSVDVLVLATARTGGTS